MAITERKRMYREVSPTGNQELDFIDTPFTDMELDTVRSFRIPQSMEFRPDLISFKFFGNFHMGWLLAFHNGFLDPINDFSEGVKINIPSIEQYYRFYARNARTD